MNFKSKQSLLDIIDEKNEKIRNVTIENIP